MACISHYVWKVKFRSFLKSMCFYATKEEMIFYCGSICSNILKRKYFRYSLTLGIILINIKLTDHKIKLYTCFIDNYSDEKFAPCNSNITVAWEVFPRFSNPPDQRHCCRLYFIIIPRTLRDNWDFSMRRCAYNFTKPENLDITSGHLFIYYLFSSV